MIHEKLLDQEYVERLVERKTGDIDQIGTRVVSNKEVGHGEYEAYWQIVVESDHALYRLDYGMPLNAAFLDVNDQFDRGGWIQVEGYWETEPQLKYRKVIGGDKWKVKNENE